MKRYTRSKKGITRTQSIAAVALIVIIMVAAVAYFVVMPALIPKPTVKEVVIASLFPLTGALGRIGKSSNQGVLFGVSEINKAGGVNLYGEKIPMRAVVRDITSKAETAVSETEYVITREKPVTVVGAYASALTFAISTVTERYKVPMITWSTSPSIMDRGYKYIFRHTTGAELYAVNVVKAIRYCVEEVGKDKIDKVAILHEETEWGKSTADQIKSCFQDLGIDVRVWAHETGLRDFSPILADMKAYSPKVFCGFSYTTDAILILETMKEMKINIPLVFGSAGYEATEFGMELGKDAEFCFAGFPWWWSEKVPELKRIAEEYEKMWGEPIDCPAGEYSISPWLIKEAIEKAQSLDPDKIRETLLKMDISDPYHPAVIGYGGKGVKFDDAGCNLYTGTCYTQWKEDPAKPGTVKLVTVYPPELQEMAPVYPKPAW